MAKFNTGIEPLDLNDKTNIDRWHDRFNLYCKTNSEIDDDNKIAFYLTYIGKDAYNLLVDLAYPEQVEAQTVHELRKILVRHLQPANFEATERAKFHNISRRPDEKLREFLLRLQKQAASCNFGDQLKIALRDRVIAGINSPEIQRRLLSRKNLTYEETREILEDSEDLQSALPDGDTTNVLYSNRNSKNSRNRSTNVFKTNKQNFQAHRQNPQPSTQPSSSNAQFNQNQRSRQNTFQSKKPSIPQIGSCFSCGEKHLRSTCKFRNAICRLCQKPGHIQKVCRQNSISAKFAQCSLDQNDYSDDDVDEVQVLATTLERIQSYIMSNNQNDDRIIETLTFFNGRSSDFILDTGSPVSIMSLQKFIELGNDPNSIKNSNTRISGISNHQVQVLGEANLQVVARDTLINAKFYIINDGPSVIGLRDLRTIFGIHDCKTLQVYLAMIDNPEFKSYVASSSTAVPHDVNPRGDATAPNPGTESDFTTNTNSSAITKSNNRETSNNIPRDIREMIHTCSNAEGGMSITPVRLETQSQSQFIKARPLAFGIRDAVKTELDNLVQSGIITPITSSSWATPIVAVRKPNGTYRLCGDYSVTANRSLKLTSFTTPGIEEMFTDMRNCTHFSKIDLTNAFLQIPIDESSKEITTINTIWGLYHYNYLPFGLSISPGIFQQVMDQLIQGLDGVKSYQDDLLIFGSSQSEHDARLRQLFLRLLEKNVKINAKKSSFSMSEIHYLGYVINSQGIKPDSERVISVAKAPRPKSSQELRSFLGFMQYYAKFIPHFSTKAEPLFQLMAQSPSNFNWSSQHNSCFDKLIAEITNGITLQSFKPSDHSKVIVDASEVGIGAILEQSGLPVICISRRLSKSEKGYSQTQKEALAIKWALQRLHKYIFGMKFTIITDHKALEHIFSPSNSINKVTSNMLQRWALEISAYDYEIVHRPGKDIPHADYLSRYSNFTDDSTAECLFITPLPFDRNILIKETKDFYKSVTSAPRNGWSTSNKKKFPELYSHRDDISVSADGVMMMGERAILPPVCRKPMLEHLHSGHLGRDKMKSLARALCWWPTMNADIADYVGNCTHCKRHKPKSHSNWRPWPNTYEPMSRIHADYCGPFLGKYYALIIEDSFSRYPEVFFTTSATANFTMTALRKFFTREGIPQTLVTDNGQHFSAKELNDWLKGIGVIHLYSAPRHPCSNGLAERFVQTLKNAIKSAGKITTYNELDKFVDNFLFQYRNAIHTTTNKTPSLLFKGRNLRSSAALDTTEVLFYRGNDSRPTTGVITRQVGKKMVEIIDEEDGSIHRRHMDQIHISHPSDRTKQITNTSPISHDYRFVSHTDFDPQDPPANPERNDIPTTNDDLVTTNDELTDDNLIVSSGATNSQEQMTPRPRRQVKAPTRLQDFVLN